MADPHRTIGVPSVIAISPQSSCTVLVGSDSIQSLQTRTEFGSKAQYCLNCVASLIAIFSYTSDVIFSRSHFLFNLFRRTYSPSFRAHAFTTTENILTREPKLLDYPFAGYDQRVRRFLHGRFLNFLSYLCHERQAKTLTKR